MWPGAFFTDVMIAAAPNLMDDIRPLEKPERVMVRRHIVP